MFGKIIYISDNIAEVAINPNVPMMKDIMNFHVIFEDEKKKILGEIEDIGEKVIKIRFLGEIVNNKFVGGVIRKPQLTSTIRLITKEEVSLIVGENKVGSFVLGMSPLYDDCPIRVDVNEFLSNHLAIFGNTGSGKSYGVARIVQNLFSTSGFMPYQANIFIFDAYGEYHNAFKDINKYNPNLSFKFITTNTNKTGGEQLRIPLWLLNLDDVSLLLNATEHTHLTIIEKMMKLIAIFSQNDENSDRYKNHLIAKAIMNILYTNQTSASKRNDIFAIIASCSTPEFNLESPIQGIGYTRKFRECFVIDNNGQFPESILITNYITSFISDELDNYEAKIDKYFTLEDMEKALDFALISEGLLRNEKIYADAITLKVRLHSLIIGENAKYFKYDRYITRPQYIASLIANGSKRSQIVNFNLEDIDDSIAKVITKIYAHLLFEFTKQLPERASVPFHLFLEEAHRYVQNDNDRYLLGYNIFERIAKEGRKYGLILNLISQRPVELSDTVISQCTNFLIFKMNHPRDLEYIKMMVPNISAEIVERQKGLQAGTCMAFGRAFKVPMIVKMQLPDPEPYSSNCDVIARWQIQK